MFFFLFPMCNTSFANLQRGTFLTLTTVFCQTPLPANRVIGFVVSFYCAGLRPVPQYGGGHRRFLRAHPRFLGPARASGQKGYAAGFDLFMGDCLWRRDCPVFRHGKSPPQVRKRIARSPLCKPQHHLLLFLCGNAREEETLFCYAGHALLNECLQPGKNPV